VATITSRQHPLVKEYRRVARGDDRLALIDGWHLLDEAVRARIPVDSIVVVPGSTTAATERILARASDAGTAIAHVSTGAMESLSPVQTPAGVAALVERRHATLPQLLTPSPALIVLAVDMQDPGNVGAVIRSAEAGGATGVALAGGSSDAWSWKALRAAMGSTFRLPVLVVDNAAALIGQLRGIGVTVLASVPRGGTTMHGTDMRDAVAIMIGGEGPGLPSPLIESASARVSIPMKAPLESLNAAVAAALLVYEARRQREVRS
jgi:RNA methyltransferase, TrmH family